MAISRVSLVADQTCEAILADDFLKQRVKLQQHRRGRGEVGCVPDQALVVVRRGTADSLGVPSESCVEVVDVASLESAGERVLREARLMTPRRFADVNNEVHLSNC